MNPVVYCLNVYHCTILNSFCKGDLDQYQPRKGMQLQSELQQDLVFEAESKFVINNCFLVWAVTLRKNN